MSLLFTIQHNYLTCGDWEATDTPGNVRGRHRNQPTGGMMAGYPINKAVIDSRAGYLVKTLRDVFDGIEVLKGVLDGYTTEQLVAMGYNEATLTEVSILKSGITDLNNLRKLAHNQATQPTSNDFFFWANKLTGVE